MSWEILDSIFFEDISECKKSALALRCFSNSRLICPANAISSWLSVKTISALSRSSSKISFSSPAIRESTLFIRACSTAFWPITAPISRTIHKIRKTITASLFMAFPPAYTRFPRPSPHIWGCGNRLQSCFSAC